jgi:hypothetical protein
MKMPMLVQYDIRENPEYKESVWAIDRGCTA